MNWRPVWKRRKGDGADCVAFSHPPSIYLSLWDFWSKQSDDHEVRVDWDQVQKIVSKKPSVAAYCDEARRGMLLLHFACALYPPLEVVEAIVLANPRALYHKSLSAEITPLMIACGRNASKEVIRLLLRSAKQTMYLKDSSGYSAIHWACREDVSKEVLRCLLIADPQIAHCRADPPNGKASYTSGVTPMDILYQSRMANSFSDNQWDKLCYVLWARKYGTLVARSGQAFSTLHAALSLRCPKDVIEIALERYGGQYAGVRDQFGNLPLHYAVKLNSSGPPIVATLLQHFPQAASCSDAYGRLPLHVALKHGHTWSKGVAQLLLNYPPAIAVTDKETSLLPCALSASFCDVETTFCLLREYPQVITSVQDHSS